MAKNGLRREMKQIVEELDRQNFRCVAKGKHYAAWGKGTKIVYFPSTPGATHSVTNAIGKLRRELGFKWKGR